MSSDPYADAETLTDANAATFADADAETLTDGHADAFANAGGHADPCCDADADASRECLAHRDRHSSGDRADAWRWFGTRYPADAGERGKSGRRQ